MFLESLAQKRSIKTRSTSFGGPFLSIFIDILVSCACMTAPTFVAFGVRVAPEPWDFVDLIVGSFLSAPSSDVFFPFRDSSCLR